MLTEILKICSFQDMNTNMDRVKNDTKKTFGKKTASLFNDPCSKISN